ncbi:hypothetical protein AALP_AA8G438700 [Arabis alpina]|uniref:CCR4-NOT transcription complex subunit 3 n=1 Tax=Arabis alpina TaxID=50452 RepID=A0A087GDA9_ARAAL|nr:hypothetical protein AALP_AA8G438700 [Arabis alpina]
MGATRKLQSEIDRALKKVHEGVEVFQSIWNKVYDTDNANQKDKFESDLKKEIKKLQRYRDQIKTWTQSTEIKDKKVSASYEQQLVDARKLIEREMERFKICEKETKTKAFSKEGLGQQPKTDPKEKAKSETRDWLNNVVGVLETQIDIFEAELEGLSVKKGKARPPRLIHLETSITRHRAHIMKLELILRLLDNDELSPEQVNDIKDFLDDYVERNQEGFDEFSDVDELYSSLPLDKVESLEDLVTTSPLLKGSPISLKNSLAGSASMMPSYEPMEPNLVASSSAIQEDTEDKASLIFNTDAVPKSPPSKSITNVHPAAISPAKSQSTSVPVNITPQNLTVETKFVENTVDSPSTITPSLSTEENTEKFPGNPLSHGGSGTQSRVVSPSENAKSSTLDVESRLGNTSGQPPLLPLSNRMILLRAMRSNDVANEIDDNASVAIVTSRTFSPSTASGTHWRPGSPFQNQSETGQFHGRTEIVPDQKEKFLHRLQQVQQQGHSNLLGMTPLAGNSKQISTPPQNSLSQQVSSPILQGGTGSGFHIQQHSDSMQQQLNEQLLSDVQPKLHRQLITESVSKNIEDDLKLEPVSPVCLSEPARVDYSQGEFLSNQQSGVLGAIGSRGIADLGTIGDGTRETPRSGEIDDRRFKYQMLEAAIKRLPLPKDSERPRQYYPRRPITTPSSYPQVQAPIINNPMFWERLGNETLFFAFYYQQNSYQQHLAARELKKQAWRYHKKLNTWFQRREEPKVATDEYEQGAYIYFNYKIDKEGQHGWCSMVKQDFAFEYQYLEDELG